MKLARRVSVSSASGLVAATFVLVVGLSACSGSSNGGATTSTTPVDKADASFPSAALSTFSTTSTDLAVELRTSPAQPPLVGPGSSGQLRITNSKTGAPVDGLSITITTWMPVMGHECTAARIDVKAQGNGVYLASPFEPSMPGDCEWILKISSPGADGGVIVDKATSPRFTVAQ